MGGLITTLENRSAGRFVFLGMLVCLTVLICSVLAGNYHNHAAAVSEAEYRIALAGRLSQAGLSDEQAAELVTAPADADSLEAGKGILAGYGFKPGSPVGGEYAYSSNALSETAAVSGVLLMILLGTALMHRLFIEIRLMTEQLAHDGELPVSYERDFILLTDEIKKLRSQTRHLLRQITGEKQYLADYLNDFSHQIKTPCTGLILNNDILSSAPMPFEDQQGYFARDRKCLERISQLTSESLKLARLDAGVVEYRIEPADISEPVSEAAEQLAGIAAENGAVIVNEVRPGITLGCDRLWLCEAVTNLAKNAAEHSPGGQVRIYADSDPMTVRLFIEDNGCGISEEELPKVFKRFYSRSNAVTSNSVGIGMSIAKRIVEDMGGRVFIDSEVGKGTKITLEFLRSVT